MGARYSEWHDDINMNDFHTSILLCWLYYISRHKFDIFFPGNIATVRSYIAAATFTEERTAQMSIASSFQSVGFTLGPGIQAALTPFKCTDVEAEDSQYLSFDMYTSAG